MNSKTLAIIVNHNSNCELEENIPKLNSAEKLDIVIVDNGSVKENVDKLKLPSKKYIKLIFNQENFGFARAVNQGLQFGIKNGYQYFVLLNPDVEVKKNAITNSLGLFKDKKVGIIQPLILLPNGRINSDGNSWHYLGFSTCGNYSKKPGKAVTKEISVASGATMIIRKELIDSIGFLEENYFLYGEDSEYSYRALKAGWKIMLSEGMVIHDYKLNLSSKKWFLLERSRLANIFSLYRIRSLIVIFPALLLGEILLILTSLVKGLFITKLKAYSGINLGLSLRPVKMQTEKLGEKDLQKYISPTITFPILPKPLQEIANFFSNMCYQIIKVLW